MAVTTQESTQYTAQTASPPTIQDKAMIGGRVKIAYFAHAQSGVGDAGSSGAAIKLPAGRVRLLGAMSNVYVNWTASSQTMDVGWDAYTDFGGTTVAADPDGLDDGVSVATAGEFDIGSVLAATGASSKVFESQEGVTLRFTAVAALADGDDLIGYVAYVDD